MEIIRRARGAHLKIPSRRRLRLRAPGRGCRRWRASTVHAQGGQFARHEWMKAGGFEPGADKLRVGWAQGGEDGGEVHDALEGRHFYFGKNYDARAGLEQGLDLDLDLLADVRLAVVNHDHGAVGQITDALSLVPAFTHNFHL